MTDEQVKSINAALFRIFLGADDYRRGDCGIGGPPMMRRFWRQDDPIDALIKAPRVLYEGHDESKATQAAQRREMADKVKRQAARILTQDRLRRA